jgi:hypothetical protein
MTQQHSDTWKGLTEAVKSITCKDHYLTRICLNYDHYLIELSHSVEKLRKLTTKKQFNSLINQKLQINKDIFKEMPFIQNSCELAVMSEFLSTDLELKYERKVSIHTKKDVDFSIVKDNISYNIEVKCPSYEFAEEKGIILAGMNKAPSECEFKKITLEIRNINGVRLD